MKDKSANSSFFTYSLHIFVLFGFAVAQPIFDVLSKGSAFLVARQSKQIDVIFFIIFLTIIMPLFIVVIKAISGLIDRRISKWIHGFTILSLITIFLIQILKKISVLPSSLIISGAFILALASTVAYFRTKLMRFFLTVLSPAIIVFPLLFLFNSPVHKILFIKSNPQFNYSSDAQIKDAPPIVIVVFDELPVTSLMNKEQQIDPIRYPNFAALAQNAYWFRNATTVSTTTVDAVPAILSGIYPDRPRLPSAIDYPKNIFTLLGGVYDLEVYESATQLCPNYLCEGGKERFIQRMKSLMADLSLVYLHILLPEDFTSGLPAVNRTWKNFTTGMTNLGKTTKRKTGIKRTETRKLLNIIGNELKKDRGEVFRQFIDSIDDTDRPTLYFSHSYLPHMPWAFLPSGKNYISKGYKIKGLTRDRWDDDKLFGAQALQHHLLQLGFVDTLLGELIDRLKITGLYDRSLIIITADHGISFKASDRRRGLTKTNYHDIMPIPLLIKKPNQHNGKISDRNVETIDILPTIADILKITLSWPVHGRSVFDSSLPERDKKVIYTVFRNTSEHKYVFEPDGNTKYKTLVRKYGLFGDGSDYGGLYTIGPYNNLIGKKINLKGPMAASGMTVTIDNEDLYDAVDLKSTYIPAHITGRLHLGDATQMKTVAVAVNGKISAVTRTFSDPEGEALFSAITPESSFRSGKNRLDVFIVSETEKKIMLSRVYRKKMISFSLSSPNRLTSSNGEKIRIVPDVILGSLDKAKLKSDNVSLIGWAAGKNKLHYPDVIAVFVNDTFFYSGAINRNRPDVVKYFDNKNLLRSGFQYQFSSRLFGNIEQAQIRVFGISEIGVASELKYPNGNTINID